MQAPAGEKHMAEESDRDLAIETRNISKLYGSLKAVDRVSLSVKRGEIYGFLGLNGAGKTTTIRMLLGMIRPKSGEVHVCGQPIITGRGGPWNRVGYMVETPRAWPELTVRENLVAASRLRRLDSDGSAQEMIALLRLDEYSKVKARNLSQGNKQRLGLAKALIHEPELLVLDEPTNGLDPAGIVEIRELLMKSVAEKGMTVFISSHNLDEVSRMATRIGIIHRGKLIREIDTGELATSLGRNLVLDARDREGAAALLSDRGFAVTRGSDGRLLLSSTSACEKPEEINALLVRSGFPPSHLAVAAEDLESWFLRTIGEESC